METGYGEHQARGSRLVAAAALAIILAGIIHLVAVPRHWEHAQAHGLLFIFAGTAEIAWGIAFWRRPTRQLHRLGVVLAGWLIALWTMTRLLPAPFGHGPEGVEVFDLACKITEAVGIAALLAVAASGAMFREARQASWKRFAGSLTLALLVALFTYGAARAAEPLFPWLRAADHHEEAAGESPDHGHEDSADEDAHDEGAAQDDHHEDDSDSHDDVDAD